MIREYYAKSIRKRDENVLLIFVSGYDKYAMELFQLDVFEFLLKPIDAKRFETCFLRAVRKIGSLQVYFSYMYKKQEFKLLCMNILFFESKGREMGCGRKGSLLKNSSVLFGKLPSHKFPHKGRNTTDRWNKVEYKRRQAEKL